MEFFAADDGGVDRVAVMETDFRLHFFAQFALGGFQYLPQFAVLRQFVAFRRRQRCAFFQETLAQHIDEIFAAQMVVARAGGYLDDAVEIIEYGYVKRPATQVVNQKARVVGFFLQTVSKAGGSRFVEQTQDVQTCHLRRVFRCLTLDGVEIGGNGQNDIAYRFPQKGFRIFFQAF